MADGGNLIFRSKVIEDCPWGGIGVFYANSLLMEDNVIAKCSPCRLIGGCEFDRINNNHFIRDEVAGGYFVKL